MIGVFDSGVGGLTVLSALHQALPDRDLLYLGDTARVPYGTRSPVTVVRYSMRVASHLYDEGIRTLVIACNTATTHALPALRAAGDQVGVQVFGVIEPGVDAALAAHQRGSIAILGTEGTIAGGAYQEKLRTRAPGVPIEAVACPLFVPLVEEGWVGGPIPRQIAEHYVGHLRGRIDTAILGCTHYPAIKQVLQDVLPDVRLVDSALSTAAAVKEALGPGTGSGTLRFRVTDHVERFQRVGERFLGFPPDPVTWVDLPEASEPFALAPL
jgi:glutamate racemase